MWLKAFRRLNTRFHRLQHAPAIILLYHRVTRLERDPWALSVSPEQFASQLSIIRQQARPIPLRELDSPANRSNWPSVIVTFDDGYEDNLIEAEPLLRRFEIPATIFVVSGAIGSDREFWWDELERILFQRRRAGRSLQLEIGGMRRTWTFDENACRRRDVDWRAWENARHSCCLHAAYSELYQLLFPLTVDCKSEIMSNLRQWAELDDAARSSHKPLSIEQLRILSNSPVIEIGVHSATHASLAQLPVPAQRDEVVNSKWAIEDILGQSSVSFSYPFGKQEHFSGETIEVVRCAAFRYACTNMPGYVQAWTDRLRLPRFVAPRLEGESFSHWLRDRLRGVN